MSMHAILLLHPSTRSRTVACCLLCVLHADTLLPDDLVSSGIIDDACRDEVDESEFESFDRLFSQLPVMKGEYIEMMCACTALYSF